MFYKINPKKIFKLIGIPHEIINYITELNEVSLKILILIFSEYETLSVEKIAKTLNISKLQIKDSMHFLANKNIIKFTEQNEAVIEVKKSNIFNFSTADLLNQINKNPKLYIESEKLFKKPLNSTARKMLYYLSSVLNLKNEIILNTIAYATKSKKSIKQITQMCENWSNYGILTVHQLNEQIKFIKLIEKTYHRNLTMEEHKILLQIQTDLNLKLEIILIAINYCAKNNVKSIKKIEKLCMNWSDNSIFTLEQAEKQIQILENQKQIQNQVKKCLGIEGRKLSTNEAKYVKTWCCDNGFKINEINLAFNKCVDSIGKLSFPYIDKILQSWNQKEKPNSQKKLPNKKFKNTSSYDLNELIQLNELEFLNEVKKLHQMR